MELFKTQAYIRAFAMANMTDSQLIKFHEEYASCLKLLISDFVGDNPCLISDELPFHN